MLIKNKKVLINVAQALLDCYKLTQDTAIALEFDKVIDKIAKLGKTTTGNVKLKYFINK